MVFQSKMTPFKRWVEPDRIEKYVNFFGPGVDAEVRWSRNARGFDLASLKAICLLFSVKKNVS